MLATDLVGAGNNEADHEDASDVKDEDTEERPPDGDRDVLARGLRLAYRDTDELRADVREERIGEGAPEAEEDREALLVHRGQEVVAHGPVGVLPVPEADAVVPRVSAEVDDDAHEQQADERDDLDAAEPELQLAEHADTEQVDEED